MPPVIQPRRHPILASAFVSNGSCPPREARPLPASLRDMTANTSPVLDQALALLREGRRVEGETLLIRAVEAERSQRSFVGWFGRMDQHGGSAPISRGQAAALFDLARYLLACDDAKRAIPPLKQASGLTPTDDASRRDRMTYGMNLGQALQLAGRLEEAESVLRANVAERQSFYGDGSEGLAWGLEPLGSVLLARRCHDEAARATDQALDILWKAGSPRVAFVLVLAGAIRAAIGSEPPFVPRFDDLSGQLKLDTLDASLIRAEHLRDEASVAVAEEVVRRCASEFGDDPRMGSAWVKLFHTAKSIDAFDVAVSAARAFFESMEASGKPTQAAQALDALATTLAEAGRIDDARTAFADSERRARALGDSLLLSHTLRNCGLALADANEPGWREKLEQAIATADAVGEPANREQVAKASGALGIRLQHEGEVGRAHELLERAVALGTEAMPPGDPQLFAMRTHLESVRAGKTCGCSPEGTIEQKHAFEAAILAVAQRSLPSGLLEGVEMGEDGHWKVNLTRQMESEEEAQLMVRALQQALAEVSASARG